MAHGLVIEMVSLMATSLVHMSAMAMMIAQLQD